MIEHIFIHISWKNSIIKQTILFCEINAQNPIMFFFSNTNYVFFTCCSENLQYQFIDLSPLNV